MTHNGNSPWVDYETTKPPDGKTVLIYTEKERHGSHFSLYHSNKTANGYMVIIGSMFHFDFTGKILCWREMDSLEGEIPMRYGGKAVDEEM